MIDRTSRLALSGFVLTGLLIGCDSNPDGPKADPNAPPPPKSAPPDPSIKPPPNPAASRSKGNSPVGP